MTNSHASRRGLYAATALSLVLPTASAAAAPPVPVPEVTLVAPSAAAAGQPFAVSATVAVAGLIRSVSLLADRYGSSSDQSFRLSPGASRSYTGSPSLPYGRYFLRALVRTQTSLTTERLVVSAGRELLVDASPSCFHFDYEQENLQGFTVSHVRRYPSGADVPNCAAPYVEFSPSANAFPADAQHGGLRLAFGCGALNETETVFFDLESPSLTARPAWQRPSTVSVHLDLDIPAQVQPLLVVRKASGQLSWFRELDGAGQPVFHELSGPGTVTADFTHSGIPSDAVSEQLVLRVFVDPHWLEGVEGYGEIDQICPGA